MRLVVALSLIAFSSLTRSLLTLLTLVLTLCLLVLMEVLASFDRLILPRRKLAGASTVKHFRGVREARAMLHARNATGGNSAVELRGEGPFSNLSSGLQTAPSATTFSSSIEDKTRCDAPSAGAGRWGWNPMYCH